MTYLILNNDFKPKYYNPVQIGCYEWGMNMVGTAQVNRTGANAKVTVDAMKDEGNNEGNTQISYVATQESSISVRTMGQQCYCEVIE